MASKNGTANSRLAEIQMKFQKKQKLEREQKKMALTGGDDSQSLKTTTSSGKVRQMFDDRRRGVGIDRSHPLRPILTATTSAIVTARTTKQQPVTNKRIVGGSNVAIRPGFPNAITMHSTTTNNNNLNKNYSISNGNINVFQKNFDDVDNIDNETFPKEFSSLSLNNTRVMDYSYTTNDSNFENNIKNESSTLLSSTIVLKKKISPKTKDIHLNPVITKKTPSTSGAIRGTGNKKPINSSRVSTVSKTTTNSTKLQSPSLKATTNKNIKAVGNKISSTRPSTFVLSVKPPPRISTPPIGMASCTFCQRHFNEERLVKHEEVCRKMMSKKRKIFDASKHRVKGTEAEKYLKKGKSFSSTTSKTLPAALNTPQNSGEKKSNWRKKHEDFIAAIREAKKVQTFLAKGGKLSDLPPPPPSENPDYIQCPHCGRRFNQSAAERHIPKCVNMQHNKPKPTRKRN